MEQALVLTTWWHGWGLVLLVWASHKTRKFAVAQERRRPCTSAPEAQELQEGPPDSILQPQWPCTLGVLCGPDSDQRDVSAFTPACQGVPGSLLPSFPHQEQCPRVQDLYGQCTCASELFGERWTCRHELDQVETPPLFPRPVPGWFLSFSSPQEDPPRTTAAYSGYSHANFGQRTQQHHPPNVEKMLPRLGPLMPEMHCIQRRLFRRDEEHASLSPFLTVSSCVCQQRVVKVVNTCLCFEFIWVKTCETVLNAFDMISSVSMINPKNKWFILVQPHTQKSEKLWTRCCECFCGVIFPCEACLVGLASWRFWEKKKFSCVCACVRDSVFARNTPVHLSLSVQHLVSSLNKRELFHQE